ncbi:flagellar filament capping protein FliD [Thermosulfuriphilus ammonigenes]|uniref:Flagellar hook-associated protein 2 n=1 Tax=Thermosulfuriphilus ammonigenes TaxID=1936021 RepID=A0A6G7PTK7_9BACT|nr:flagellar filament capping protein FliD [Thermosulfuriphilus ammonigenes]MBA2849145.1 flagellar hook-associated protein 2 [Thermosulfuriphilus ammonigenes]QIJ70763.1 flagellar filament capping protein FliD [Thermosulfuriphilus ammonigenes]
MAISVSGLVSGLDVDNIIQQLVELERRPIKLLENQEEIYNVKLSAYGTLRAALNTLASEVSSLKNSSSFEAYQASSSDESILTVSTTGTPLPGSHEITVNRLATSQKLQSAAFSSSTATIGTGTLRITVSSGTPVDIEITSTNNSLSGIAQAINEANAGVSAQVVNDGTGNYYLLLSANQTGASNTITIDIDEDGDGVFNEAPDEQDTTGLSALAYNSSVTNMTETQAAQDAELIFDGLTVYRSSNTFSDLIEGVEISLVSADSTKTVTISISRDIASVKAKLATFVEAYNGVVSAFQELQKYDAATGETGALFGDATTTMMRTRLQRVTTTQVTSLPAEVNSLAAIGIAFNEDGKLEVDDTRLTEVLQNYPDQVSTLFTDSTNGLMVKLDSTLDSFLNETDGAITSREDGIQESLDRIAKRKEVLEERISRYEERLRKQFNNLELILGQYQQTSDYLSRQIDLLTAIAKGGQKS